jgi:hypothetical protein
VKSIEMKFSSNLALTLRLIFVSCYHTGLYELSYLPADFFADISPPDFYSSATNLRTLSADQSVTASDIATNE